MKEGVSEHLKQRIVLFFNQSQKPTECKYDFLLYYHMPRFVQTFYASMHSKLYKLFILFPAGRMNSKNKIKKYKKIIDKVCREYNGAKGFIVNKAEELCFQEGISAEEVSKT